jgi:hypothetical protein
MPIEVMYDSRSVPPKISLLEISANRPFFVKPSLSAYFMQKSAKL